MLDLRGKLAVLVSIVVRDLSHGYADGRIALRGLSFAISAGERAALLGPNGAGKTTLFLCLAGVLRGKQGTVTVAGLDPAVPVDRAALPKKLGVVFQNPDEQLFAATVLDDVAFAPLNLGETPDSARRIAEVTLIRVGLADFAARVPHRLSGGEKRRAALAGVLATSPEVLLLDEPTAALDPRGRRELAELLVGLPGTMLIATHNLDFARRTCTRALILNAGSLAASGTIDEILADESLLAAHGLV